MKGTNSTRLARLVGAEMLLLHSSLADGVENAAIVCCFISSDYEQSENCQLELQYASKRGKRVIRFMLCNTQSRQPFSCLESLMDDFECIKYDEDCQSDIESSAGWLVYLMSKKPLASQLIGFPLQEQPSYLYELVKHEYKRNSRIERFMNPAQSFSIDRSYINLALVETTKHQKKETKLRDTGNNNFVIDKFEEIYGTKRRIDIKDIFKTCKNNEKKVLVCGRAGIGKSTFCRYAAHQWACGAIWSEYDLVAFVPLRSLTEQNYPASSAGTSYDLIDVLRKTCFDFSHSLPDTDVKFLHDQFRKIRILWLLDGYDEIVQNVPKHLQHLLQQLLGTHHHIVTSRPYQNTLSYQVRMEIIGFTDENIPKYITQFFDQVETEPLRLSSEAKKLLHFLKLNPRIWGIAHIPINLELICSVWSNTDWSETKTMTITMLYEELNVWLCRRYLEKQREVPINEIGLMNREEVYHSCEHELRFLESLAFLGMERNAIVLGSKLLAEASYESKCSLTNHRHILNIGILKSLPNHGTGTRIEAEKDHYFVHLSFQEYFAARYLINTLQCGAREKAMRFVQSQKYNRRFNLLFRFASGLAVESNCRETIELFWNTLQCEPVDLIGIRHTQLLMTCFDEVLHIADLPNHDTLTNYIQEWTEHVLCSSNVPLQQFLSDSLQSCISITNDSHTQCTFIRLIEASNHSFAIRVLRLICTLQLLRPHPRLLCTIVNQLDVSNLELKQQTLTTLASLGEKAATSEVVDPLTLALRDADPEVRWRVCEALQSIGEKAATTAVIDRLVLSLDDENPEVRSSVCRASESIRERTASTAVIHHLFEALGGEYPDMRSSACEVVERIGEKAATTAVIDHLVLALGNEDPDVRSSARRTFESIGQSAASTAVIDRLVLALGDENPGMRRGACFAVGRIGEKAGTSEVLDRLVKALGDENPYVRRAACFAAGRIGESAGTSQVVDRLVLVLGDVNRYVRLSAFDAVGKIGKKAATTAVIDRLILSLGDVNRYVRLSAFDALGKIGNDAATIVVIDRLVLAIGDANPDVRSSACQALGMMGEKAGTTAVVDRLILALGDEDPEVRSSACQAFGRIGERAATKEVIQGVVSAMQLLEGWSRRDHWGGLVKLLNFADVVAAHGYIGNLLRRWVLSRDDWLLRIIWPICMMMGAGITVNGRSLLIFKDSDPEIIEVVDARLIDELVKEFTSQARTVLGLGCWRFSRGLKRNRDGTVVDSSRKNVSWSIYLLHV